MDTRTHRGFERFAALLPAAIVLIGLALRLYGLNFGLPFTVAPDEPTHFSISLRIFRTGDLNPHWLNYPSLMFYLDALALVPYFAIGRMAGIFASPSDIPVPEIVTMGVGKLAVPSEFLLTRGITALVGAGSIVLVYRIVRELHSSRWVAALAALLFAFSPASVYNSHLIRPDTLAVFFALFSFFWARRILNSPSPWNYVWAGAGAGLAVSAKYNMPLVLVPLIAAHFLRLGRRGFKERALYLGIAAAVFGFVATTPYALLDYPGFLHDMGFEVAAQAAGHAGFEGNTLPWYISFLWANEGIVAVAALVQAVRLVAARTKEGLVLVSFPVSYFAFINLFVVRNDRTVLPLLPFLDLLAALLVADVHGLFATRVRLAKPLVTGLVGAFMIALIARPLLTTVAEDIRLAQPDGRDAAREWLERNLSPGARVAQEAYTPYVDTTNHVVLGVFGMIDHSPAWYVQNGFEYLIFSQGSYGRYFLEPERYPDIVAKYNELFRAFPEVAHFDENGYEVRVFKTGTVLPAQRIGARFGNESELVELIGYDPPSPAWTSTEPPRLKLTWRTLGEVHEPLVVLLRLLDKDDRELGTLRKELELPQSTEQAESQEMFATEWAVPVATPLTPGLYRVSVDLIQARYSYVAPVFSPNKQKADPLLLGPFKLAASPPSAEELRHARSAMVKWGNEISLLSYAVQERRVPAGETLSVVMYWKADIHPSRDYTVFLHLLDANGAIRAQVDAPLSGGAYPTSVWDPGEMVRDEQHLNLASDLEPGEYRLEIGLYTWPDMARLEAVDSVAHTRANSWTVPDSVSIAP